MTFPPLPGRAPRRGPAARLHGAGLLALAAASLPAQDVHGCEVALLDGSVLAAESVAAEAQGHWRLALAGGGSRRVALEEVLALHCAPVRPHPLPAAHLVGGDVVRGLLEGGDSGGNALELVSPVLGRVVLPVDRLACLVLRSEEASADDLVLPDGIDEALFLPARLGFDRVAGTVYQFGEGRVRFQAAGADEPRWYPERDLIGLRLAGGVARAAAAPAQLLTRAGDRLGVEYLGLQEGVLQVRLEQGREAAVRLADVGCLLFAREGVVFLSELTPAAADEAAFDGPVLLPWRRDATVTGDPLTVGGRTHARGIGAHSRSRLAFTVPEGAQAFWTRVAFDDAAQRLRVRGEADVRVELDGREVFAAEGLRAGDPPRSTGLLPVRPGQQLALVVDFGAGRDLGDRVDWLTPVFLPGRRAGR